MDRNDGAAELEAAVEATGAVIGRRRAWVAVALVAGVAFWAWLERQAAVELGQPVERQAAVELGQPGLDTVRWVVVAAAAGLALLPPVRGVVIAALGRIRHPSPKAAERAALMIGLAAAGYFMFTAIHQGRDLFPKTHDEGSYAIQTQMLARGRLWMPQHPLADFFDSFYVIVRPVYASQYFPGMAVMYVPAVWLGWPSWLLPVLASGAVVGLVYRIVTEIVDGAAGALAALMMVALGWFRMLSTLLFSQVPMLLLGLLMVWAWLRWRRERRAAWLLAAGALAGWGAITRPQDALCYAVPIGVAIAVELRGRLVLQWAVAAALLVAGAVPFLSIQIYFNQGVTGSPFKTPFQLYAERDFPRTEFGFPAYDPAVRPASPLPQKQELYEKWVLPYVRRHQPAELPRVWVQRWMPMAFSSALPARVLLVPMVVGALGLTTIPRRVLWTTLPLFFLAYVPHTFFLEHYAVVFAPAALLGVVLGFRVMGEVWPRFRDSIASASAVGVVALSLASLPELNPRVDDEPFHSQMLEFVNEQVPYLSAVQKPAVILFRYTPGDNPIEEPVYNFDVAWPDDAPIVRAHDLGERNREIFQYYAKHQPDRTFYRFDRRTRMLEPLGTATALVGQAR